MRQLLMLTHRVFSLNLKLLQKTNPLLLKQIYTLIDRNAFLSCQNLKALPKSDFDAIASSISNLTNSHRIRHTDVIEDKIIQIIQERTLSERNGADDELIKAYKNKLDNLNRERNLSVVYMEHYYETVTECSDRNDDNDNEDECEIMKTGIF